MKALYRRQENCQQYSTHLTMNGLQWIRVYVLILSLGSSTLACPNNQECQCHTPGPILYCKGQNLNEVPHFDNTNFEFDEVTLAENRISSLPADAFKTPNGEGLHTVLLDLTKNRITSISNNAFAGLEDNLEILKLDVSSMSTFPTAALTRLVNLKQLYLKGFSIDQLPAGALSGLTSLQILSFENCGLNSLSDSDFTSQSRSLEEVHLKSNAFNSVPKQALSSLSELLLIDLGSNTITTIANNDFSEMNKLQSLDLSQNGVDTIQTNAFSGVGNTLRMLSLSRNGNTLIHSDLTPLQSLTNLRDLDLSYNAINQIPSGFFQSMNLLENLNMRGNELQTLTSSSMNGLGSSLKTLNLAENSLRDMEQLAFQSLSGLQELSLDHNTDLSGSFTGNTFVGLDNLQILKLMKVGFRSSDFMSLSELTTLQTLNLEENAIDSVPDFTFQNHIRLKSLDLAENSIVTLTQRSLHGLQNSLESLWLDNNQIETLPSCLLYGFNNHVYLGLGNNPLRCDCDAYWLRLRIDNMDDFDQIINDWKCASPDEHDGKFLKDISHQDLCDPAPDAEQCEQLSTTPEPTAPPTTISTTAGPSSPMVVDTRDVKAHSMKVVWVVHSNEDLITKFTLECQEAETGKIHTSGRELDRSARDAMLEELSDSTQYVVCVTAWINDSGERTCTDATTMPGAGAAKAGFSALQIILGCVLAVVILAVVVGAVACFIYVYRRKKNRYPPIQKSTQSLNSQVPIISDQSKRFSKPKPFSISTDNIVSSMEMERRLEGFSQDERDRILQLFSKSGASTLSMMSASSSRYVGDPTGAVGGPYSNEVPIEEGGHYEELPEDQYNYIPFDEINPDIVEAEEGRATRRPTSTHSESFI